MDRSSQRNVAFLCGAAGAAMGGFAGSFLVLFLARTALPAAMLAVPDWLFAVWLLVLIGLVLGLWPALDYVLNRRPAAGALLAAGLSVGMQSLGIAALVSGLPLDFLAWFSVTGGLLLAMGGLLAGASGGTEPLTWATLRSPRVATREGRLDVLVGGLQLLALAIFAGLLLHEGYLVDAALLFTGGGGLLWIGLGGPLGRLLAAREPDRSRLRTGRRQGQ
jgi:hypothetical protein